MALLLCSAVVSSALARVPLLLPQQLQPLLGAPVAPWLSPRCCQLTMTAPPPPADQGRAARRRRGRAARAARRQKNGPDGERAIARKAHQAASKAAGGTAELARRGHAAAAAAVGGADELARQAGAARVAANPLGSTGVAIQRGIGNAIAAGKYTKYPGVRYRRETGKWRVQFKCQGKLHTVGQWDDELTAARAHDTYVREHRLRRPLHFPREDKREIGSFSTGIQPSSAYRPRSLLPYAYERYVRGTPQADAAAGTAAAEAAAEDSAATIPDGAVSAAALSSPGGGPGNCSTLIDLTDTAINVEAVEPTKGPVPTDAHEGDWEPSSLVSYDGGSDQGGEGKGESDQGGVPTRGRQRRDTTKR